MNTCDLEREGNRWEWKGLSRDEEQGYGVKKDKGEGSTKTKHYGNAS